MAISFLTPVADDRASPAPPRRRDFLRSVMEGGLLVLVCLAPWAFGATPPFFESLLYLAIALLLLVWTVRILLQGDVCWKKCPVAMVLAAILLYGACQLTPLPPRLLSWLSPATARLYAQLLPSQAETLPFRQPRESPTVSTGSTLSLYPGGTQQELLRLLAVLSVFMLVRISLASTASLRRLAMAALINGTLLSLFALMQFFTAPSDTLYWTWPSAGTVFGPFICRNHFACYLNLCVGLGLGLLLGSRYAAWGRAQSERSVRPNLLHDPLGLWIIAALALMISSVVFCASRGGIVALVSGGMVCLAIDSRVFLRFRPLGAVLLTGAIALALVSWFGFARIEARLATLWPDEIRQESRLSLWQRLLPLVKEFPVWGTGYGTFQYVEPLCRSNPADEEIYTNAENEYLEGLVEGGGVRLVLSLLAIGLVYRLGYQAVRRDEAHRNGGLALGCLFGFTTLLVQSVVDFGLHIPAIALLTAVLCAHLCALGSSAGQSESRTGASLLAAR